MEPPGIVEIRVMPDSEAQSRYLPGNEIGIVGIPAEPLVGIGLAIWKDSGFSMPMAAAFTMGESGCVGLSANYGAGGCETIPSRGNAGQTVGADMIPLAGGGEHFFADFRADVRVVAEHHETEDGDTPASLTVS